MRRVPALPAPGGYVEVLEEHLWLGGEAANTAFVLSKWNADVELFGNPLGIGPDAELLHTRLAEHGLTDRLVSPTAGGRTPVCDVYVTPDGDRTMFGLGFSGIADHLSLTSLPITPGRWFTADPNMRPVCTEAIRLAADGGMHCYLMDFFQLDDPVLPGMYWQSSTDWVGHRDDEDGNLRWVSDWVAERGCFTILTDGLRGVFACGPSFPAIHLPPYPVPVVVDSTGAGDMFRAGMLCGLSSGWEPLRCLQFGSAAGALSCQGFGATGCVPSVEEVETYVRANPQPGM